MLIARSFCCSSLPKCNRFAGLRLGFPPCGRLLGLVRGCRFSHLRVGETAALSGAPGARRNRRAFPQKSESTLLHHVGASFVSLAPTFFKSQSALTPLLLLSNCDPLGCAWAFRPAGGFFFCKRHIACDEHFYAHRSLILLLLASQVQPLRWVALGLSALRAAFGSCQGLPFFSSEDGGDGGLGEFGPGLSAPTGLPVGGGGIPAAGGQGKGKNRTYVLFLPLEYLIFSRLSIPVRPQSSGKIPG